MEVFLISIPFSIYVLYWVFFGDHETKSDKDKIRFFDGIKLSLSSSYLECWQYFNEKVKQFPKSAIAHFYLGKCHAFYDNFSAAVESFQKSLNLDNTLPETYFEKAKAHFILQEFETTLFELKRANWHFHNKNAEVLLMKAKIEIQQGDFENAEKSLNLAIKLGDEDANFLLQKLQSSTKFRPHFY
jgi:tetratricopeptide (TPR) repeat protein